MSLRALALSFTCPLSTITVYSTAWHWNWVRICLDLICTNEAKASKAPGTPFFTRDLVEWRVLALSMSLFLCSFGYGGVTSFVAIFTEKSGIVPKGLFFAAFSLTVLFIRPFVARYADRIGPRRLLMPLLVLVSISFVALAFATTAPRLVLAA